MKIKKTVESLVAAVTSTDVAAIERELRKLEGRRAELAPSRLGRSLLVLACFHG